MRHSFLVTIEGDPEEKFKQLMAAAKHEGATLDGDSSSGRFVARGVEGTYSRARNILTVTITKKPMFVTVGYIEAKLRDFFEGKKAQA